MALLEKEKEDAIDARKILEQISQKVAENPIEITTYEDGTIVKIDHVSRTAEITKPNGESIFVDHKTETMVSQNLIEKTEQKTPAKDHEKDNLRTFTAAAMLLLLPRRGARRQSHRRGYLENGGAGRELPLLHADLHAQPDRVRLVARPVRRRRQIGRAHV